MCGLRNTCWCGSRRSAMPFGKRSVVFGLCVGIISCGKGSSGAAPVQPMLSNGPCSEAVVARQRAPVSPHREVVRARRHAKREAGDVHRLLVGEPAVLADSRGPRRAAIVYAPTRIWKPRLGFLEARAGVDVRCHGRREHQQGEGSHRGRLERERLAVNQNARLALKIPRAGEAATRLDSARRRAEQLS